MKYVLPISYQGNERSSVEAAELAKDDKSRLAKFAEQFDGTMSFANPVNPRAAFDSEENAREFRMALVEMSRIDLQNRFHYQQLYPIEEVPSA
ncbi:MAG: hypothetical protein AABX54_01275 [Nanoarchaeota archaeon]